MKNVRILKRALEVDEQLVLRTPQVEAAIQRMSRVLQTEAEPITYLSGLSGSGVSSVLDELSKRLGHLNGIRCFKLARPEIDDEYLPPEYLLHHFGFRFGAELRASHYHTTLPKTVVTLGKMLAPSVLLVDDYLAGVAKLAQKRTHQDLWKRLSEPPILLQIVLSGPSNDIKGSWASHQTDGQSIHIEEWCFNDLFLEYLRDMSLLSRGKLKLEVDLSHHAESLFKLSSGNTARLLFYIRECARNAILSAESGISAKLFNLSIRDIVYTNAKLYLKLTDYQ